MSISHLLNRLEQPMASNGDFVVGKYFNNPLLYVKEILGVNNVEPWQIELMTDIGKAVDDPELPRRFAVRSGHGVGKTALMSWLNKWFMTTRPDPQIVVTANTEQQLTTKTWRELAKWNQKAIDGDYFEHTATKFFMKSAPKTWFASAIPWSEKNSEAFAGTHEEHLMYQFDEASAIADIIFDVSEGAMTTPGCFWLVFGNPTRNTGRFSECWGKYRHRWKTYEVDSRNVSIADQKKISEWVEDEGEDSDFVRVRVRGLPPRSSMFEFIGQEDVENCIEYTAEGYEEFPKILGIDIARFGDDRNVIAMKQGRKIEILKTWTGLDGMQSASRIIETIQELNPELTFIDGGGVGGPVFDRVKQIIGDSVIEINFGSKATNDKKWFNKRTEMWGDLRDAMRAGLDLPDITDLKNDLLAPLYKFSPKEQIMLERKQDIKKRGLASTDYADAVALLFAESVVHKDYGFKMEPVTEWSM